MLKLPYVYALSKRVMRSSCESGCELVMMMSLRKPFKIAKYQWIKYTKGGEENNSEKEEHFIKNKACLGLTNRAHAATIAPTHDARFRSEEGRRERSKICPCCCEYININCNRPTVVSLSLTLYIYSVSRVCFVLLIVLFIYIYVCMC